MENLKDLLYKECTYRLREDVMDRFLDMMNEVKLKRYEPLIAYGTLDTHIYILKEGIMRMHYLEGKNERTHAFALPGTLFASWHSYYMRQAAFLQLEACTDSVVLKISKSNFDALIDDSHEFAKWVISMAQSQLYSYEMRLVVINGTARERFAGLIKNRPKIMENVSQGIIASYLGITESYLSRLKKEMLRTSSGIQPLVF